jgi:putative heme-binding domain-containing protein
LLCQRCHAIGGAGGQVGPDLISIGASAQVDYLVESIYEPTKKIKENYNSLVVLTDDGRVTTGIKVRETDRELVIRTAEDQIVPIERASIEEQSPGNSLMPVGLVDNLTRDETIDLVRFLSELGKVGPYSLGNSRVVRRWQVLQPTPASKDAIRRRGLLAAAVDSPEFTWTAAYSQVSGSLPLDVLPGLPPGFVRFQLQANAAGVVKLLFNSTAGLSLWIDGAPHDLQPQTLVELPLGTHTLTLAVDAPLPSDGLRIELADIPGSSASVQIVGGK